MEKIGKVSLKNSALVVAQIQFSYNDGSGDQLSQKSDNIVVTKTLEVDPDSLGVPDGATITFIADVELGKNQTASESFQYEKGNTLIANYELSGNLISGVKLSAASVLEPVWENWSKNLVYQAPGVDQSYFYPTSKAELQSILGNTSSAGVQTVRVSGQRHSQPPLVTNDNRDAQAEPLAWIIDMSCYKDLGTNGDKNVVLDAANNKVTVNTGVSEDQLDAFLTANDKMLATVTAGGFFSVGGMVAVDVNGASVQHPIFSETVSSFTIMGQDGTETVIDKTTAGANGYDAIQFARVSLGALGVVTSVTIDVLDRPYANTLVASKETFTATTEAEFVSKFNDILNNNDRVESFYNPYSGKFMPLIWNIDDAPTDPVGNKDETPPSACELAGEGQFGAPYEGPIAEPAAEFMGLKIQKSGSKLLASGLLDTAFLAIDGMFKTAQKNYSDLWLTKAARVIFMSYFVELPGGYTESGLAQAWKGLDAVTKRLNSSSEFMIAGPMEFRFMKGGDAVMAGTYNKNKDSYYVNLDLIGFTESDAKPADYQPALLSFFADIEREWVNIGGLPHNGKMYGFYDPSDSDTTSYTPPFNQNFLQSVAASRADRVAAFDAYRQQLDPTNLFANKYVKTLLNIS